ncbi:MAG: Gfo/Idh/MocA family oxidoreductase, partial [bacterium]
MDTEVAVIKEGGEVEAKPLRIGIIGCGGIAQTHIGYYKKTPGVSVVAGADIRPAALEHMKNAHGVNFVYDDFN